MTDDDAARLRALATASLSTVKGRFDLAMEGDAILALLDALDEARRERDEAKRVIDDAYAALGGDAWWMDPPDGGSPTLAEMVAKANEDGRALYDVKRERDAAVALLRDAREELIGLNEFLFDAGEPRDDVVSVLNRIDALLGGGEGA